MNPGQERPLHVCFRSQRRSPRPGRLARQPALSAALHPRAMLGRQPHRRPPCRRPYSAGDALVPPLGAPVSHYSPVRLETSQAPLGPHPPPPPPPNPPLPHPPPPLSH